MASLIFSLGNSADHVLRIMTRRGAEGVERVYLVTMTTDNEIARKMREDAIRTALSYLNAVGVNDVRVVSVDLDRGFDAALLQVSAALGKIDRAEIYLADTTPMLITVLYFIAQILAALADVTVTVYDDLSDRTYTVPLRPPRVPKTQALVELLRALTVKQSVGELAERLGKSQSTVLKQLESLGELVECKKAGRERVCEASVLGRVVLNLMGVV